MKHVKLQTKKKTLSYIEGHKSANRLKELRRNMTNGAQNACRKYAQ